VRGPKHCIGRTAAGLAYYTQNVKKEMERWREGERERGRERERIYLKTNA